jgi:hypothetical protein
MDNIGSGLTTVDRQSLQNKDKPALIKMLEATSAFASRMYLAARAGLSFSGKRDIYTVFGYPRVLSFADLFVRYQRQDIAGRIVDEPVSFTWDFPPEVLFSGSPVVEWNTLVAQHKLWSAFEQADTLCYFGRFAAIILGFDDTDDLSKPVGKRAKLVYTQAYGEDSTTINQFYSDPRNPKFGLPLMYSMQLSTPTGKSMNFGVHESRVIHVVDKPLQNRIYSIPRMEKIYNLLDDILKVAGGSAETCWLTSNRGMQADVDKEMELGVEDAKALSDEIEEFQHQLRRFIRTRGVKITNLGSDVIDPRGVFAVIIGLLAGATGIPQRILMGSEAGQLASEQDRANWSTFMDRRRKNFAEPFVLRPALEKFMQLGMIPQVGFEDVSYKWPSAFRQNPLERGQTMAQVARAVVNLSKAYPEPTQIITVEEARRFVGVDEGNNPTITD